MGFNRFSILMISMLFAQNAIAQMGKEYDDDNGNSDFLKMSNMKNYLKIGDSAYLIKGICKNNMLIIILNKKYRNVLSSKAEDKKTFLKIHGNILYEFSYQSYVDTPFAQNDVSQHLIQTNLTFTLKDKYPIGVSITRRSNNSPYFRDFTDINVQFYQRQLLNNIKTDLITKVPALFNQQELSIARNELVGLQSKILELNNWLNNPARTLEIVAEKERLLRDPTNILGKIKQDTLLLTNTSNGIRPDKKFGMIEQPNGLKYKFKDVYKSILNKSSTEKIADELDSLQADSSNIDKINERKKHLERLIGQVKNTESKVRSLNKNLLDSINKIKSEINSLKCANDLYAFMKRNNIQRETLTKTQQVLLSVNKIGIGRNSVDYSELTVKNISLAGLNMEINPNRLYLAFAAGKINYRFRDFIYSNTGKFPEQRLYLVRAGVGKIEKNNIIATFYNGYKSILNYTPGIANSHLQKVMGISLEAKLLINENNYFVAEVAKSSFNTNAFVRPPVSELMDKVFDLSTHSNEAYSIKLFSQNPATDTKITGYYKKIGQNFQSFNLFPINVNQDAWMMKVNQQLIKRKLIIDAAIRKNDFVSPLATQSFSNQAIFKSLQATLRVQKYPFVTVGYYPSSQLSLINGNTLVESQYNTLNTIVTHSYRINRTAMNSNAVFTKFYNTSTDTGFIYYNATSATVSHSVSLSPFSLQTSAGITKQRKLRLFTLEEQLNYQLKIFSVNAGIKWHRVNQNEDLFGGTTTVSLYLKAIGTFQFNFDKSYLPDNSLTLKPVHIGRMSFYKDF